MVGREASLESANASGWINGTNSDERLRSTTSRTTVPASIMLCVIFTGSAKAQPAVSFDINGANSVLAKVWRGRMALPATQGHRGHSQLRHGGG